MRRPGQPVRALITAGGTREPIDDVRVVANSSTGRFGLAIARALHHRGVQVTVLGAAQMATAMEAMPPDMAFTPYKSFSDLQRALDALLRPEPDLVVMAAAVADYSPIPTEGKIPSNADTLTIHLHRNPKLLAGIRAICPSARLIGFKLLSDVTPEHLVAVAQRQREGAQLDATVANRLEDLNGDAHPVWWVDSSGADHIAGPRADVADALAERFLRGIEPDVPPWERGPEGASGRVRGWWRVTHGLACGEPVARAELAQLLVQPSRDPDRPCSVPAAEGGVWIGGATLDVSDVGEDCPVWASGVHLGSLSQPGGRAWLRGDADRWVAVRGLLPEQLQVHSDQRRAWGEAGWDAAAGEGWVEATPPWRRNDTREAASMCLLDVVQRRVLVGRRNRHPVGRWAFPGGRLDAGETPLEAATRELAEEAGIHLDTPIPTSCPLDVWVNADPCWHISSFVVRVPHAATPHPTDEMEARWCFLGEALRLDLTQGTRRVLELLRGQAW